MTLHTTLLAYVLWEALAYYNAYLHTCAGPYLLHAYLFV